jgi:hypothetical protein
MTATVPASDEHNAIISCYRRRSVAQGHCRSRRGYSEKAYRYRSQEKAFHTVCLVANCAKDNCTNEFEFQNKLATSLSGLTNYFADASKHFASILCRTAIKQRRPNSAKREPPTNVPAGLVKHQGAPAMAPTASVASPFYKQFPNSALTTWSECSTVTGSTERLDLLLFRHLTSFTIPILDACSMKWPVLKD